MCAPGSEPFSSTHHRDLACPARAASCLRRIAVARPPGRRRRRPRRTPSLRAGRTGRGFLAGVMRVSLDASRGDSSGLTARIARSFDSDVACRRRACAACSAACYRHRESTCTRSTRMSYSIDLSGRVALVTGASSGLGAQFAQDAGAGRRRGGAGRPPHRAAEDAARRDRGRRRRRPRGRARRDRPRQHQGRAWRTPRPRWARSTSWSTTRASARRRS